MRAIVAIVLAIVILFVGLQALGLQAQQVQPDMNNSTNLTTDSYNLTNAVFQGAGNTLATALPWMGMSAIVLLAGGLLVYGGGGR